VQGFQEYIPFQHELFDGALHASTTHHHLDPQRLLQRERSELERMGKLVS